MNAETQGRETVRPPEHGLTLRGADAISWLDNLGFETEADSVPTIRFDIKQDGAFGIARAQHTGMRSRLKQLGSEQITMLFIVVEGALTVTDETSGVEHTLERGDAYAFPSSAHVVQVNTGFITKIGVMLDSSASEMGALPGLTVIRRGADVGLNAVVATLVGTILRTDIQPGDAAHAHLRSSVEQAVLALYAATLREFWASGSARLLTAGRRLIELEDVRRKFTVHSLSAALGVSDSYLRRVFREEGTSPLHELDSARIARAKALTVKNSVNRFTQTQIADRSGFPSLASMRRALKKAASESTVG